MTDAATTEPPVLTKISGGIGRITLNRPRALNALNHEMVLLISGALQTSREDDAVTAVLIDGAGDRGLCAGGDIRAIYDDARSGGTKSIAFWRDEYRMNGTIARYPKPVVSLMDGVVMGGGVGVSAHASHRVVTERSVIAMPEVNIGLVPDVGGTYLLANAPGWLGLHAALTGIRLTGADVITLGMADHFVERQNLASLIEMVCAEGVEAALQALSIPPPPSALAAQREWIDSCYSASTAQQIVRNLRSAGIAEATAAAEAITAASPTSVLVALEAIRSVRRSSASIEQALDQEYRMVGAAVRSTDLIEGIRAQVIDKDRNPTWSARGLEEVPDDVVRSWFAPIEDPPFPDVEEIPAPHLRKASR